MSTSLGLRIGRRQSHLQVRKGACKDNYPRRKVVWDKVVEVARSGWNAAAAYNLIYTVYGWKSSVTTIINQMIR